MKKIRPCVGFLLVQKNRFLAEKRKKTKRLDPGVWAIPGGGIKKGESPEKAAKREAMEELGIHANKMDWLCSLPYYNPIQNLVMHYFVFSKWTGKIRTLEAEKLEWIPVSKASKLGACVDRQAMRIYKENRKRLLK